VRTGMFLLGFLLPCFSFAQALLPQLQAQVVVTGEQYSQSVRLSQIASLPMQTVATLYRQGEYIQKFNRRVKHAAVRPTSATTYELTLIVGGIGVTFEHVYSCTEDIEALRYVRVCQQIENRGKPLLRQSRLLLECVKDSYNEPITCNYTHSGVASGFKIVVMNISSLKVALGMYFYEVGYLAQMGLVFSREDRDADDVRRHFGRHEDFRWFKAFEARIDAFIAQADQLAGVNAQDLNLNQSLPTF
jgi:hypothetical protein